MACGWNAKELILNPFGKRVPVNCKPGVILWDLHDQLERLSFAEASLSFYGVYHCSNLPFLFCTIINIDLVLIG